MELLSDAFMDSVQQHAGGNPEAKASEMEHAIRKHCTIHFDEDPAFYKRLGEKLEKLIQDHQDNWEALAEGYEGLRREAQAGRTETVEGLNRPGFVGGSNFQIRWSRYEQNNEQILS